MRHTDETKRKLSAMRSGERNPFFGKKHTPETLAKIAARTRLYNAQRQYIPHPQKIVAPTGALAGYLAGIIDGDGSVCFVKKRPRVTVYGTCRPLMDWLKATLGNGSIGKHNTGRELNLSWTITAARDVHALLVAVRPFMIVKATDADEVLDFYRRKYGWEADGR
jgi:hypothetical protein